MKKILSIVLLSVVMLSVMIIPSFAASLGEWEQEYGLNGYYTLNLNDPLAFGEMLLLEPKTTNTFFSAFLIEDVVCMLQGELTLVSANSDYALVYSTYLDVVSISDLDNSLLDSPFEGEIFLYCSSYVESGGLMFGSNVLENLETFYNIFEIEHPSVTEYLSFDSFVTVFTNFADSTQTPIVDSTNNYFELFFDNNTTFTATNSIMELPAPPPPPPIVIEETGNVFTSVISWAGSFVNTVFNNIGLLILFLLGVGISIVLVAIRILRKVMWSK